MQCDRCQANIEPGEEKQHLGQTLCEDCYMDALSPVKTCDPWAVHSAKSFEKHAESTPTLRPIQSEITSNSLFYTACRLKPCPSILKVMICPAYGKRPQISNCIFRRHPPRVSPATSSKEELKNPAIRSYRRAPCNRVARKFFSGLRREE